MPVIYPDEIGQSLTLKNGLATLVQAGRIAIVQREAHLAAGDSFGIETTFTGHSELDLMRRARTAGYRVNLVFVGLDDVQLSASRVRARVRRGGHDVPLPDVFRRFDRSMANLATGLILADRSYVVDNSLTRRRLLLSRENGRVKHLAKAIPAWAIDAIPSEVREPFSPGLGRRS
jgi:predicted ABC-type ATPase